MLFLLFILLDCCFGLTRDTNNSTEAHSHIAIPVGPEKNPARDVKSCGKRHRRKWGRINVAEFSDGRELSVFVSLLEADEISSAVRGSPVNVQAGKEEDNEVFTVSALESVGFACVSVVVCGVVW